MHLYSTITDWYHLVDPVEDHADEAQSYERALLSAVKGPAATLLELGAGAGNNAFFMKRRFRCTLADLSPQMQALSRAQNPDCEHVLGDMRALQLDRTFDAVFVHDAVAYMTTRDDLLAVAKTAFQHTRKGGAALFAPDYVREAFHEATNLLEGQHGGRALRGIEWCWDPDASDTSYAVEYMLLLREGDRVTAIHDRHVEGLFSEQEWHEVLAEAGFSVTTIARDIPDAQTDRVFLCRRQ
jgi:trans-aconitate methyltransferase